MKKLLLITLATTGFFAVNADEQAEVQSNIVDYLQKTLNKHGMGLDPNIVNKIAKWAIKSGAELRAYPEYLERLRKSLEKQPDDMELREELRVETMRFHTLPKMIAYALTMLKNELARQNTKALPEDAARDVASFNTWLDATIAEYTNSK